MSDLKGWIYQFENKCQYETKSGRQTTTCGPWGFRFETIEIELHETSPFLALAAEGVVESFAGLPGLTTVRLVTSTTEHSKMKLAPDLVIQLSIKEPLTVTTGDDGTQVVGTLTAKLDSALLPLLSISRNYHWGESSIAFDSTTRITASNGVSVPEIRGSAIKVGNMLGDKIAKSLHELYDSFGLAAAVDASLIERQDDVPNLPWPQQTKFEIESQVYGLRCPNQTTWLVSYSRSVKDFAEAMKEQLMAAGWSQTSELRSSILGMKRGQEGLQVFEDKESDRLRVVYGIETSAEAFDRLLVGLDAKPSNFVWFLQSTSPMEPVLRRRILQAAQQDPPQDWLGWWLVARLQFEDGSISKEAMQSSVKRAEIFAWLTDRRDQLESLWKPVAERLGLPESPTWTFSPAELEESGLGRVKMGETIVRAVAINEPFLFFTQDKNGLICGGSLIVKPGKDAASAKTVPDLKSTWRDLPGGSATTVRSLGGCLMQPEEKETRILEFEEPRNHLHPRVRFTVSQVPAEVMTFRLEVLGL